MEKNLRSGFMLVEVLIALALFGLSAVILVDGAFVATRVAREMVDTRELEQDLIWVRSQVLRIADYQKFSEGGEIESLSMGGVSWETEVEMTDVLDLYKVVLRLEYEGNDDYKIEAGERESAMYLLRPTWGGHGDFSTDRARLLDDRRRKMQDHKDERRRNSR
jgi:type II secretory pathway pseudopilin PulG